MYYTHTDTHLIVLVTSSALMTSSMNPPIVAQDKVFTNLMSY